jgi:hypothetical protein
MKYSAQVFDVEVPIEVRRELREDDIERVAADQQRVYERLHGEGSAHPEGGSEITAFVVRARGVTDPPTLAAPIATTAPAATSRQVYWRELGGHAETSVIRLGSGGVLDGTLAGPLLLELPDTVIVLRPGQRAEFVANGSLVIDVT